MAELNQLYLGILYRIGTQLLICLSANLQTVPSTKIFNPYIESNPVRAKIVENIADYKWSSYKERCLSSESIILDEIRDTLERNSGTD